jgi:protein-glutamine gamma-glutamyltransferase
MIKIANQVVPAETLLKDYPQNSIEAKIIKALSDSSSSFSYSSLEQLQFELSLRKAIIQASYDLAKSRFAFAVFRKSRGNPEYWERESNGGLRLKAGAIPSEAIKDIYKNSHLYASECATAMIIVYLKAMLSVYPEDLFNQSFREITLMNWSRIPKLLAEVGRMNPVNVYLPGDRRYVANPDVNPVTPEWQGENVIDLGNGTYYGHGIGIHDVNTIIKELNENRRPDATKSAYLMDSAGRPNFKNLANIYLKYKKEQERT